MQEEKRRILTKEKIREHFLRSMAVELALMILLIVLAEGIMVWLTVAVYHQMPHIWMMWVALLLLDVGMAVFWVLKFCVPIVKGFRYIASGRFRVVEDKLVGVGEDEVMRRRKVGGYGGYYTIDMLYFESYGHIPEDQGKRGYGPIGSMFYLIVLEDKKQTLYSFYSSQLYCYKF